MGKGISSCGKACGSQEIYEKGDMENSRRTSKRQNPKEIMNHYQKMDARKEHQDTYSSIHKQSEMSFDAGTRPSQLKDGSDLIFSESKSEIHLRPTEGSILAFMNLQFSSATECFHHYLIDGGAGKAYKEDNAKVVPNKLLDFIGETMQNTTECILMQKKDEPNSQVNY